MKYLLLVLMSIMISSVHAGDGWEGSKVKVPKNTLLCSFSAIEKALILREAGDKESINFMLEKGACSLAPNEFYAVVTKDASLYTNPNLAELTIGGFSAWVAMRDVDCCYK